MVDVFPAEKRSWIMSRVKGRDTRPEKLVRTMVHRLGFRFRLHRRDLPGKPDIVFPRLHKAILVHGCFWHGHTRCARSRRPTSNKTFWNKKLDGNIARDKRDKAELRKKGWHVLVVWECEGRKPEKLSTKVERFLSDG